jgi:subtilisin-like proprotein convertase family protein
LRQFLVCALLALATLPAARAAAAPLETVSLPGEPRTEAEPNDTLAEATPIQSGERIRASLSSGDDVDYYSFTAQAGELVFANTVTAASTGPGDTVLTVLNGEGIPLAEDDNDGSQLARASSIAAAPIPAEGTYYLQVRDGTNIPVSPYDLYFQLRPEATAPESEPNDSPAQANPLPEVQAVSGSHETGNPDWFSINLQAGDTVFLSLGLAGEASKAQLGFGLAGDAGKPQTVMAVPFAGESPDASSPSEAMTMTVSASGTYYVRVASSDEPSTEAWTYDLSATVIPAAQLSCRTYASAGGPIPDGGAVSFPIEVADSVQIVRAALDLNLQESVMKDLAVSLRTPSKLELPLFAGIGAGGAEEQTEMEAVFDDFAAVPSQYKAVRPLDLQPQAGVRFGLLAGQQTNGTWSVIVRDNQLNSRSGTLRQAKLILCGPESLLPLSGGGGEGKAQQQQEQPRQASASPPALSGLTIAPARFRAANAGPMLTAKRPAVGGAVVGYQDSQAAQTNFVLSEASPGRTVGGKCLAQTKANATKRPCTRWVKVISFVRHDASGRNRFGFTGRVGARKLPPGEFQLQATAYAPSGQKSKPATVTFTVLPPATK